MRLPFSCMQDTDFYGLLSAALHLPPDFGHKHGPSADGLAVVILDVEAQVEVPPVVEERDQVGHELAGCQAPRGVAAPPSPIGS